MSAPSMWVPADEAVPTRSDTIDRFTTAAASATRLAHRMPGVLASMRECMAGTPRAKRTDDIGRQLNGISDPVAAAALENDQAAELRRELLRCVTTATRSIARAEEIAELFPTEADTPPVAQGEEGPGDEWCSNCYLDGQYFEPITMQRRQPTDPRSLVPYHRGLCKWCGDMRNRWGFLPPANLLDLHHRSVRITAGMWAAAQTQDRMKRNATKKAEKVKRKKR